MEVWRRDTELQLCTPIHLFGGTALITLLILLLLQTANSPYAPMAVSCWPPMSRLGLVRVITTDWLWAAAIPWDFFMDTFRRSTTRSVWAIIIMRTVAGVTLLTPRARLHPSRLATGPS